jgi:rhodanese-related sulfurtransferase
MASHAAARRAVKAGYKNVSVMADGISGWKEAGQKTATPPAD